MRLILRKLGEWVDTVWTGVCYLIWTGVCYLIMCVGVGLALFAVYIIASQLILWLKSGYWMSLPLVYLVTDPWPLLEAELSNEDVPMIAAAQSMFANPLFILSLDLHTYLDGFPAWLAKPDQWIGLHRIARWVLELLPVSLTCFVLGANIGIQGVGCAAKAKDELGRGVRPVQPP